MCENQLATQQEYIEQLQNLLTEMTDVARMGAQLLISNEHGLESMAVLGMIDKVLGIEEEEADLDDLPFDSEPVKDCTKSTCEECGADEDHLVKNDTSWECEVCDHVFEDANSIANHYMELADFGGE